jgi:hypothetical protein
VCFRSGSCRQCRSLIPIWGTRRTSGHRDSTCPEQNSGDTCGAKRQLRGQIQVQVGLPRVRHRTIMFQRLSYLDFFFSILSSLYELLLLRIAPSSIGSGWCICLVSSYPRPCLSCPRAASRCYFVQKVHHFSRNGFPPRSFSRAFFMAWSAALSLT